MTIPELPEEARESKSTLAASPPDGDMDPLSSVRSILLEEERQRIRELKSQIESIQCQVQSENKTVSLQVGELQAELNRLERLLHEANEHASNLDTEVDILQKVQADLDGLIARVTPALGDMIGQSIRNSRDDMAEALGPIMGEAIRVQIRDSRKDMIEALYPVIGETVQRAISEFAKEFQRNIDARLRASFGPQGILRTAMARLRGVPLSQLAMRDALPFTIREIFLIQHKSGLLIAHSHPGSAEVADSDLISAMLTAIRDFVHDAFGEGQEDKELDEIQYGDEHIIIQSGRVAYLAVVTRGVEPEGFRAKLHTFISELHVKYEKVLRQYNGDPASLPNLQPKIARLVAETTGDKTGPKPISRNTKLALIGGGLVGTLLLTLACFYLQFTLALYPIAFPKFTPTLTSTSTPTSTLTSTPTSSPTFMPTHTNTPVVTFAPSPTSVSYIAIASGNVWVRQEPEFLFSQRKVVLLANTPVKVLAVYGDWIEIEWQTENGIQRGWVPVRWMTLPVPIPAELITPTSTP